MITVQEALNRAANNRAEYVTEGTDEYDNPLFSFGEGNNAVCVTHPLMTETIIIEQGDNDAIVLYDREDVLNFMHALKSAMGRSIFGEFD